MRKLTLILTFITASLLWSCSDEPDTTPRRDIEITSDDKEIIGKQNNFAFDLLAQKIRDNNGRDNILISPFSVATSLTMVANGAEGKALKELSDVLGFDTNNIEQLNNLNCRLLREIPSLDKKVKITMKNSIWIHPDKSFYPEFSETMEHMFMAQAMKADFMTQTGIDMFNAWCKQSNEEQLSGLISQPEEISVMLANVTSFDGEWLYPFDEANTKDAVFTNADGTESKVKMMLNEEGIQGYADINFYMVRLPYSNGAFRMSLIKPNGNKTVADVLEKLNHEDWVEQFTKINTAPYRIKLPRFKYSEFTDLKESLAAIGLNEAMSDECSDYTGITPPSSAEENFHIMHVNSSAAIDVSESGTKASASTGTSLGGWILPSDVDLVFDRPFIFVIDEVSTGTILFAGVVNKL